MFSSLYKTKVVYLCCVSSVSLNFGLNIYSSCFISLEIPTVDIKVSRVFVFKWYFSALLFLTSAAAVLFLTLSLCPVHLLFINIIVINRKKKRCFYYTKNVQAQVFNLIFLQNQTPSNFVLDFLPYTRAWRVIHTENRHPLIGRSTNQVTRKIFILSRNNTGIRWSNSNTLALYGKINYYSIFLT